MDDWTASAPIPAVTLPGTPNHPGPVTAPLTRPAPSWMTNAAPYQTRLSLDAEHFGREVVQGGDALVSAEAGQGAPR
jgi:hypothetical protein